MALTGSPNETRDEETAGWTPGPSNAPGSRAVLTWRTGSLYIAIVGALAYWTSYSEGVVSATSFHSLSPPINITVVLFLLCVAAVPFHDAIRRRRPWARALLVVACPLAIELLFASVGVLVRSAMPDAGDRWHYQPSVVAALLMGIALYPFARRTLERMQPLDAAELISIYSMLMVGTLCTGYAVVQFLTPTLVAARHFATPENRWRELFFQYLPSWFGPVSSKLIRRFWLGGSIEVYWSHWIGPLAIWLGFALTASLVMFCLCALFQRHWIDRERLSFPLVYLPLEMARPATAAGDRFFQLPLFWLGFLFPVLLHAFNGLNSYYPAVPTFSFRHINAVASLQYPPWNAIGGLDVTFYPLLIGFTYLIALDVSFSVWAFFLIRKLEPVLGRSVGWHEIVSPAGRVFPFTDQQATGAFAALVLTSCWTARRSIALTISDARTGAARDPGDPLSARELFAILAIAMTCLCAFSLKAGLGLGPALGFFLIFFAWCIAITRIRAEAGLGGLTGPMTPQETLVALFGTTAFRPQDLTVLAYYRWFTTDLRSLASLMPAQMEDFRMIRAARLSPRSLLPAVIFAAASASVLAFLVYLPIIYHYGGASMNGQRFTEVPVQPFTDLGRALQTPRHRDTYAMAATLVGGGITLGLAALRYRYTWWPLHPIGYAVGFSRRTIEWMWFSVFLGWLVKLIILSTGGLKQYRRLMPIFLGLILGEFSMGMIFGLVGTLNPAAAGYQLYP